MRIASRSARQEGQAGILAVMAAVIIMITVPVAYVVQASGQSPASEQAVFGQAALSAAEAGVQDYIDHVEANGASYVNQYCSNNYFTPMAGTSCGGADSTDKAFLNDAPATHNDATSPSSLPSSDWVSMPSSKGGSGNAYSVVESYNFLIDTASFNPQPSTTPGTYTSPVVIYATGRAGASGTQHNYIFRRVKATIAVPVTVASTPVSNPPKGGAGNVWGINPCATPSASTNTGVTVPSWANYAVITVAGGAGANGGSTLLDSDISSGGQGAGFTATIPVSAATPYLSLIAGCAGVSENAGGGGGSAGNGSQCDQALLCGLGLFLGGIGGGGGGASAILQCPNSVGAGGTCTAATATSLMAVAAGGGGAGGDATIGLGSDLGEQPDGGAGGAGGLSACTSANDNSGTGCAPSSGGTAVVVSGTTVGYLYSGSNGTTITCGGGGGGGGTASAGAGGTSPGGACGWLGTGKPGGAGGTSTTAGSNGSPTTDCTNKPPSGCATSGSLGGGGGGGEAASVTGMVSGAGAGGGGGYTGGGGGVGGGVTLSTGTGGGGGGGGASYVVSSATIEPYSTYGNTGNGIAYISFFSNQVYFTSYTFSGSGQWAPTVPSVSGVACLGQFTAQTYGAGGSTGGNTGGLAGGGTEAFATVPPPTFTTCTSNPSSYVSLYATLGTAANGSGASGTAGSGWSSGGIGIAGACNSPQCAGGEGGGATALCQTSPCTAAGGGTPLVVAGGGGGGGGKANGNNQGGNGGTEGAAGGSGNGPAPGTGGCGGATSGCNTSATGVNGSGAAATGAGGGAGGGGGYSSGGGGGTSGSSVILVGSGGGGGGGGGNSYPSYASLSAIGNQNPGSITIYYAYTSTSPYTTYTPTYSEGTGTLIGTQVVSSTSAP